jgi:alginate O-acetyltransferase complex protein AlgJ
MSEPDARGGPGRRSWYDAIAVAAFCALLVLPLVGSLTGWGVSSAASESRELAAFPQFRWRLRSVGKFAHGLEGFFNDHFGFRRPLIWLASQVKVRWFEWSPNRQVVIGKRGWLYLGDAAATRGIPTPVPYGAPRLSPETLEQWRTRLQARQRWLDARGICYVFVVAREKSVIYPEALPPDARRALPTPVDELVAYLRRGAGVRVVDVKDALITAKSAGDGLYYRTDTHWTYAGAYVGYLEIMKHVRACLPSAAAKPLSAFTSTVVDAFSGDLSRMLGPAGSHFAERATMIDGGPCARSLPAALRSPATMFRPPFRTECRSAGSPSAMLFHDSFSELLIPFLANDFARVTYVWNVPGQDIDLDLVARERPRVVIHQMIERGIAVPPSDAP